MRPDQQLLDDLTSVLTMEGDVMVPDVSIPLADADWVWVRWLHRRSHEVLGHCSLMWSAETLHWAGLWAPRSGTITAMTGYMPEFCRQRGIKRFTAVGIGDWVWKYLEAVGFQPVRGDEDWLTDEWYEEHLVSPDWKDDPQTPLFVADIGSGCRLDQYHAWKEGGAQEPGWHKQHEFRRSIDAT